MERLKRNPEKFEVIDLFTAMGREHGYKLHVEEDAQDFIKRVGDSLKESKNNDSLVHGKRVESLFGYVAAALGACKLIKQEDSGEAFLDDKDMIPPDYKVILESGEQLFIEVKNCHFPNINSFYPINKSYMEKVSKYADLHDIPLLFAVYFSRFNKWFLLSKEGLIEQKKRYAVNFLHAMTQNQMSLIGDRMIGTLPKLSFELLADPEQESTIDEHGQAKFVIGNIKLFCNDDEITDDIERNIAFYLMCYGTWPEQEEEGIFDGGDFLGVRYTLIPESLPEGQEFATIGDLSSMISAAYAQKTVYEKKVVAVDTDVSPRVFGVNIPKGYKGDKLPLWQFSIKPNPEFQSL